MNFLLQAKLAKLRQGFSHIGQISDPRQSWKSWGDFWDFWASFKDRQSWQSSERLFLIKRRYRSKVGKVGAYSIYFLIQYAKQSWQSSSHNGQISDPLQSWQRWGYFWDILASLKDRQSWDKLFCIRGNNEAKLEKLLHILFIFVIYHANKVGKVQTWIFLLHAKLRESFSHNGQISDPRQSWQSWGYFWDNLASFKDRQSLQSLERLFLIKKDI
jgi:hypothetical protein